MESIIKEPILNPEIVDKLNQLCKIKNYEQLLKNYMNYIFDNIEQHDILNYLTAFRIFYKLKKK